MYSRCTYISKYVSYFFGRINARAARHALFFFKRVLPFSATPPLLLTRAINNGHWMDTLGRRAIISFFRVTAYHSRHRDSKSLPRVPHCRKRRKRRNVLAQGLNGGRKRLIIWIEKIQYANEQVPCRAKRMPRKCLASFC